MDILNMYSKSTNSQLNKKWHVLLSATNDNLFLPDALHRKFNVEVGL